MKIQLIVALAGVAMAPAPVAIAQTSPGGAPVASATAATDALASVQNACLPVLRGGAVQTAARSAGFKLENGGWVKPIVGKSEIDLDPPDVANPHVCTLTITAPANDKAALRSAIGDWAAAQNPPLAPAGVDQSVSGGWVTSTWSGKTAKGVESVVLTQPQGGAAPSAGVATGTAPPTAAPEQTTLLVSLSPA